MQIESIEISRLIPDPNNARLHDEKNLKAIQGSLAKFGQQTPIVIDENNVVLKGNGTVEAAKALGWTTIQTVRSDLKSNTEKVAYSLADNRTSELANWDMEILGKELLSLQDDDFDIGEIGFDDSDLRFADEDFTGIANGPTQLDKLEKYLGKDFHEIKLNYSKADYELVIGALDSKLETLGVDDYSQVVLKVLGL